jgi:hypothetical protein
MAIQTDNLVMAALGVVNDQPPNSIQPPLANGIHLRFSFAYERGFPWYGYYLFRRLHEPSDRKCLQPKFNRDWKPGPWRGVQADFSGGIFTSDAQLVFLDQFPPTASPEFDLRRRKYLRFELPAGGRAREFHVKLGMLGERETPKGCLPIPTFGLKRETPETPVLGPIILRGFDGQVRVAETAVSGRAGDIVTALLGADTMTSLEIQGGPAALIDICTVAIEQDLTRGWTPLINQPLCLPVEHADYPCPGKPATFAQAESLAQSRIRYGPTPNWIGQNFTDNFADLNGILNDLVEHGPAGVPMADRTKSYVAASPDDPGMPKLRPLEIALLGSLHPAVAMMLGLYYVDSTAQPGATYDYMVMADHGGRFHGDPKSALDVLAATSSPQNPSQQVPLPDDFDLWVTFGKKREAAPPLAPPVAPRVYALPGAITGSNAPASSLPLLPLGGRNMAGLTWQLNATPDGSLLPDAPIGYHLWRATLGETQPSGPPPSPAYDLLTADRLIVATETPLPLGVAPERASDWPPFPLKAFDPGLPDGWYSYCLSTLDIFGRHSAMGAPGAWLQWAWPAAIPPASPAPKPWYYIDPPADRQLNAFAVQLLDKTPPPRVPGVEADALDLDDKMLLRDAAFTTWWNAIEPTWWNSLGANQDQVLPLRVRWKWTATQMLQAPNTREFRIYFNPGTDPPAPDHTNPGDWHDRIYFVDYSDPDHVSLTTDADGFPLRLYEVLLPVPNGSPFPGVPLAPSETEPIVYAHVSVSAADDKQHTPDNPKWTAGTWGNRPGNEGKVGVPAKIYRVLRSKPLPPVAVDDSEKVWATKADYQSLSYYTFRWAKSGTYKAHIYRALDDTLFQTDWERRKNDPTLIDPGDPASFPIATWDGTTRDAIATKLNKLSPLSSSASFDETVRAVYEELSERELRTLAGLPGNEKAFSQITYQPLDPDDTSNADRAGPDGIDTYAADSTLCAYTAELDGRASNRYFFRAAYVNAALTVSSLGPSSPAVYLPKVEPPRTPVITKILGGDRAITLTWAVNREPDLAEYRIYRTDNERNARDIRAMERAAIVPQSAVDMTKPAVEWIDATDLIGGQKYFYRLTSVNASGNESPATEPRVAIAIDVRVPDPPTWTEQTWLLRSKTGGSFVDWPADGVVPADHDALLRLRWECETPEPEFVIRRWNEDKQTWMQPNSTPIPANSTGKPAFILLDYDVDPALPIAYRLKVRSSSGVWSIDEAVLAVRLPDSAELSGNVN